jgi:hypothetical protein
MPVNTKHLKRDAAQIPVPQYFDTDLDDFVPLDNGMYIKEAQVMIPTEQQSKYAETRQTHTNQTVNMSGTNTCPYQDLSGYTDLAVTFTNSATATCTVDLLWSHDGTTAVATETILASGSRQNGYGTTKRKARFVAVKLTNGDSAAAKTMNSWLDLTM